MKKVANVICCCLFLHARETLECRAREAILSPRFACTIACECALRFEDRD